MYIFGNVLHRNTQTDYPHMTTKFIWSITQNVYRINDRADWHDMSGTKVRTIFSDQVT